MVEFSAATGEGVDSLFAKIRDVPEKFQELQEIKKNDIERQRRRKERMEQEKADVHIRRFHEDFKISEQDEVDESGALQFPSGERVTLIEEEPFGEESGHTLFRRPMMNESMIRSDEEEMASAQQREKRRLEAELLRERQEQQRSPSAITAAVSSASQSRTGLLARPLEDVIDDSSLSGSSNHHLTHFPFADDPEEQRKFEELKRKILKKP